MCDALHVADKLSHGVRHQMMEALWSATISGGRTGTPGEPFQETIEQRDRSRALATEFAAGSIERRFYADMAKFAEKDIQPEVEDGLPTDGRSW